MAKVIWKGNGLGIAITSKGIKIIPPCDPELLAACQAVLGLQGAARAAGVQREAAAVSAKLGSFVAGAARKAAGEEIDAEGGVVFFDAEDGFTCGSTGKPPIPLPGPLGRIAVPAVAAAGR